LPGVAAAANLTAMELTIHTQQTAPEASKPILEGIASDLGVVPNMAATVASSPTLLSAFDGLRRAVGSGELDPKAREVAGLAVGVAVDNRYGVALPLDRPRQARRRRGRDRAHARRRAPARRDARRGLRARARDRRRPRRRG
jgi:hypothetical protein